MNTKHVIIISSIAFVALLVLAMTACVLFASVKAVTASEAITWDLRKGPGNPAEVNWPASVTQEVWERRGNFDLAIIGGSGDVVFHERVQSIICRRRGSKLTDVLLHFGTGSNAEEAYQTAKRIMKGFHDDSNATGALEVWHDAISRRVSRSAFLAIHQYEHEVTGAYLQYPGFAAGHVRLSETSGGGRPENGNVSFTISVAFP